MRFRWNVRNRIVASLMASIFLLGASVAWVAVSMARSRMMADVERQSQAWAGEMADQADYPIQMKSHGILRDRLQRTRAVEEMAFAAYVDPDGHVLAFRGDIDSAELETLLADRKKVLSMPYNGLLVTLAPVVRTGVEQPIGHAVVGVSTQRWSTAIGEIVRGTVLVLFLGLILFGTGAFWLVRRSLAPLHDLETAAASIAEGNLGTRVEVRNAEDEFGRSAGAVNAMVANLEQIVVHVQRISERVIGEADNIGRAAKEVLQGSTVQADSSADTSSSMEEIAMQIHTVAANAENLGMNVAETASSIEQMGANITQMSRNANLLSESVDAAGLQVHDLIEGFNVVADNVGTAEQMSIQAAAEAQSSGDSVLQTVEHIRGMGETIQDVSGVVRSLGDRGMQIKEIVSVIEDIADQTNLLSLNAAIEAARAGDAGRGFAVVADEIRKLAERSVTATEEIGEMISGISGDTKRAVQASDGALKQSVLGLKSADQTTGAIKRIRESVNGTSGLMRDIRAATDRQQQVSRDVTAAMGRMSQLTTELRSAASEQARGAAQIVDAVEGMRRQTDEVRIATEEQKQGGEMIMNAITNIADIAQENLRQMRGMNEIADGLIQESEDLRQNLARLRVG